MLKILLLLLGASMASLYILSKVHEIVLGRSMRIGYFFIVIGIIGIALCAAQITPPRAWDLSHHYTEIDKMREYGLYYALNSGKYKEFIGANALFYLVSRTPWNSCLVFIAVVVSLGSFELISHYSFGLSEPRYRVKGISFFLYLVLTNIVLTISGIRNVMAVTLVGLAVWLREEKKFPAPLCILIGFFGITIHPASTLFAVLYLISFIPSTAIACSAGLVWMMLASFLSQQTFQSDYLASTFGLFEYYIQANLGMDMRVKLLTTILAIMCTIYLLFKNYHTRYHRYSILCYTSLLGCFFQNTLFTRMTYGLAIPSIYLLSICQGGILFSRLRKLNLSELLLIYVSLHTSFNFALQTYELIRAILQ